MIIVWLYFIFSFAQLLRLALMEEFVWLMDQLKVQAGWRSASVDCGEQCVVLAGIKMLPQLCADNWGTTSTQVHMEVREFSFLIKELM